jgi:hypothetical protein
MDTPQDVGTQSLKGRFPSLPVIHRDSKPKIVGRFLESDGFIKEPILYGVGYNDRGRKYWIDFTSQNVHGCNPFQIFDEKMKDCSPGQMQARHMLDVIRKQLGPEELALVEQRLIDAEAAIPNLSSDPADIPPYIIEDRGGVFDESQPLASLKGVFGGGEKLPSLLYRDAAPRLSAAFNKGVLSTAVVFQRGGLRYEIDLALCERSAPFRIIDDTGTIHEATTAQKIEMLRIVWTEIDVTAKLMSKLLAVEYDMSVSLHDAPERIPPQRLKPPSIKP